MSESKEHVTLERNERCRDIARFMWNRVPTNSFYWKCWNLINTGYLLSVKQADTLDRCYEQYKNRPRRR